MKGEIFNRTEVIADASAAASTTGFDGILYILSTAGTLKECDEVGGTYTDVDAKHYIASSDNKKVAYIGYKKFIKVDGGVGVGVKFNAIHQG